MRQSYLFVQNKYLYLRQSISKEKKVLIGAIPNKQPLKFLNKDFRCSLLGPYLKENEMHKFARKY